MAQGDRMNPVPLIAKSTAIAPTLKIIIMMLLCAGPICSVLCTSSITLL